MIQDSRFKIQDWAAASPRILNLEFGIRNAGIRRGAVFSLLVLALAAGCRQEMYDQPKYKPLGRSDFFSDARNERPLPDGVVARGFLRADARLYRGTSPDGKSLVTEFPLPATPALLARGQERFNIYCAHCHDRT